MTTIRLRVPETPDEVDGASDVDIAAITMPAKGKSMHTIKSRPVTPVAPLTPSYPLASSVSGNLSPILTDSENSLDNTIPRVQARKQIPTLALLPASGAGSADSLDLEEKGKKLPVIPSFPPTGSASPVASNAHGLSLAHKYELGGMADILEVKLREEALRGEKLEEEAVSTSNGQDLANEQWDASNHEVDLALININTSNTASEFQGSAHGSSVLYSDDAIQRNFVRKDGHEKALPTMPRDEGQALNSTIQQVAKVGQGQDNSVVVTELPVRTLEQEYIESGIKEYLAQEDATARTGNVDRRARVRTKKSTGRDLREKGRLRGSVRNSEIADVVNPSGDEESTKPKRELTRETREKGADGPRSIQSRSGQESEGSTRRRPSVNSHWSQTWVHQKNRGSEPYRPYIYPSEPVTQSSEQVVEGLYIGRNMILTPPHWAQQHPYAELLDSRYYYHPTATAPRHRIEPYPQSEAHQPSHRYERAGPSRSVQQQPHGYRPQFRPLPISGLAPPIYAEYQYQPQFSHPPYYHYQDNNEPQSQPSAPPQRPALPGHRTTNSDQSLPGPMLFPTPAATLPNNAQGTSGSLTIPGPAPASSKEDVSSNIPIQEQESFFNRSTVETPTRALLPSSSSHIEQTLGNSSQAMPTVTHEASEGLIISSKASGAIARPPTIGTFEGPHLSAHSRSRSQGRDREGNRSTRKSKDTGQGRGSHKRSHSEDKPQSSGMDISEFKQTLHVSSENFEKIITDLEDMLTQALELAGRAVEGGALAGGLGYSPSTRKDDAKSAIVKRLKPVMGMTSGEDTQNVIPPVRASSLGHRVRVSRPSKERKDSLPALYPEEAIESSLERLRAIAINSASCEAVVNGLGSQSRLQLAPQEVGKEGGGQINGSDSRRNAGLDKHVLVGILEALDTGPALSKVIVACEQSRGKSKNQGSHSLLGAISKEGQEGREVWESSMGTVIPVDGGYHDFLREMARNQLPMKSHRVGSNGSGGSGLSGPGRPDAYDRRRNLPVDRMWHGLLTNRSSEASGASWGVMRKRFTTIVALWVLGLEWGLVGA